MTYTAPQPTAAEIARQLEMNRATVYVIHHRLKKQLIAEVAKLRLELD